MNQEDFKVRVGLSIPEQPALRLGIVDHFPCELTPIQSPPRSQTRQPWQRAGRHLFPVLRLDAQNVCLITLYLREGSPPLPGHRARSVAIAGRDRLDRGGSRNRERPGVRRR